MQQHAPSPLVTKPVWKLIMQFAIPGIISNLISATYNIVDQIFIGQSVGLLGNAATNVAFPLVTLCLAISMLLGIGGASNFSLCMGRGEEEKAAQYYGASIAFLAIFGLTVGVMVRIFLRPLMLALGATAESLPYAMIYTGITAFGMPFQTFITAGSHLIRADGGPKYAMISISTGAILNIILDPLLIFTFDMGIAGAAWATVIGQIVSFLLQLYYFLRLKKHTIRPDHLVPRIRLLSAIAGLGCSSFFNQAAMMCVQITLNNVLRAYGAVSVYGSDIPIACVGVISKVNVLLTSFIVGIAQGCQPINGFNYGAQQYSRVKKTYVTALASATVIATSFFLCFQFFPRQILSIFDSQGSELYFQFGTEYLRIYMMMTCINSIQPMTGNFFSSIGKAKTGVLISLTRQLLFLLPLILLLSHFLGIDGIMFAAPIADFSAAAVAFFLVRGEFKRMSALPDKPYTP